MEKLYVLAVCVVLCLAGFVGGLLLIGFSDEQGAFVGGTVALSSLGAGFMAAWALEQHENLIAGP